jgi:tRNA (cytidine/uridine-2'-O-)-methyltransferase
MQSRKNARDELRLRTSLVRVMRLALYEPDIPQNAGALIRLGACLGVGVDIIEPCGFLFSDAALKRAALDYRDLAAVARHASWDAFLAQHGQERIVLLSTKAQQSFLAAQFQPGDVLVLGRESSGVPEHVHTRADLRLRIPLKRGLRSLNVAQAGAIVLAEALRQTGLFPL